MNGGLVFDDIDAIYLTVKSFVFNGFLYLGETEHWHIGGQFAVTNDIFASGIDVTAMRRLRARDEIQEVVNFLGVNHLNLVKHL